MPLRDLVCILEATESPSRAALDQALALARGYGVTASILIAGAKASAPYSFLSAGMVGGLVKSENEKLQAQVEALAAEAQDALKKSGAGGNVERCVEPFSDVVRAARARALCHDLTVTGRPGGVIERSEALFEELLFSACRPVLLPVADGKPAEKINKLVLAWDGSPHAARALAFALAFFAGVKEAEVAVVRGEKDLTGMVPAASIAAHIERHGAKTSVAELKLDEQGVSATIDAFAVKARADLIVMGAFGRSRIREFTLGGVTRDLTRNSRTPLLLAH